jgi:hypothetical protein|tara:strand:+ start:2131 stop:3120 length:990 start_codon:yes stop_codon:yes gene_type:complete
MADADYKHLKRVENTQDATLSNLLLENFIMFFDWGLVDLGGFYSVQIPETGLYGGDKHKLRAVKDPNYNDGQVWEGFRSNWVWETGVQNPEQPIQISGVFIGGTFRATGNIQQPFHINYPDGRVVLDTAISTTSEVKLEYSHKWVNVIPAEGVPWFRQIQQGASRLDNSTFTQFGSGDWAQLGQTRVQLPAIAVETIPNKSFNGYQLGGGQFVNSDMLFYVIAETHWECNNLIDQISFQNDRAIWMFDTNKIALSGVYPLNYRGELNENALPSGLYPQLVDEAPNASDTSYNFRYRKCYIGDTRATQITEIAPNLYMGTVRFGTEVKAI